MAPDPSDELSHDDVRGMDRVVRHLRKARRVLAVTGAGISADSGVPTYRGVGGLYHSDRLTPSGLSIEEVLSGEMLRMRPDVTWTYLKEIERACRGALPNRAHRVLAEMQDHFDDVWILTQNVDGLHAEAGSRRVLDVHGDLHGIVCSDCSRRTRVRNYEGMATPPLCPDCGGVLRPDVVLFGEELDSAKLMRLEAEITRGFDVVFSIGTSSLFDYVAAPVLFARAAGKPTIEINPDHTAISGLVDVKLKTRAAATLDRIWNGYMEWWPHT